MSKAERIRSLASQGLGPAEIARELGTSYQHAYNVLKRSSMLSSERTALKNSPAAPPTRPLLSVDLLLETGFKHVSRWILSDSGGLLLEPRPPAEVGVYVFVKAGVAVYVGVATMGLSKRLYFYSKPGITQRTSQRLNRAIRDELAADSIVDVYAASPPDLNWNGLPVNGSAGLELGLIKKYSLPWNMRSAR